MDIKSMYQEIILGHNKNPSHYGEISPYTHKQLGHNPSCGDKILLFVNIENEIINNISFKGEGCAISKSSASLMTEAVINKSLNEVKTILEYFEEMLLSSSFKDNKKILGKLLIFEGVKQYPARIKCALLACKSLQALIDGSDDTVSIEK